MNSNFSNEERDRLTVPFIIDLYVGYSQSNNRDSLKIVDADWAGLEVRRSHFENIQFERGSFRNSLFVHSIFRNVSFVSSGSEDLCERTGIDPTSHDFDELLDLSEKLQ